MNHIKHDFLILLKILNIVLNINLLNNIIFIIKLQKKRGLLLVNKQISTLRQSVVGTSVLASPFEVRPTVFELLNNGSAQLEVLFAPTQLKSYSQQFAVVCDNCQVKYFTISGELKSFLLYQLIKTILYLVHMNDL